MNEGIWQRNIYPIIRGVLIAYGLLLIMSLLGALLVYFCALKGQYYHSIGAVCCIISLFLGGYFAARSSREQGWLKGIIVGALCVIIMLLISLAAPISAKALLTNGVFFVIAAGVGGICGIK